MYIIIILGLSNFEKHPDLNSKSQSRIFKGFLLKYLMTCILAIIASMRINIGSYNSYGLFDDFTQTWFNIIGYTIVMRFIINPLQILLKSSITTLWLGLKRCKDRKLTCDMRVTKSTNQRDYEKLYLGTAFELDLSYSEITNILFVTISLSPLLPQMYWIAVFNLAVLYWKDKCQSRLEPKL